MCHVFPIIKHLSKIVESVSQIAELRTTSVISPLKPIVRAAEWSSEGRRLVAVNDGLNGSIGTCTQKQQANTTENDVEDETCPSPDSTDCPEPRTVGFLSHAEISHTPEDEAEERIEQRAHQREQVGEERNDFCDNESQNPKDGEDACPRGPA